MGTKTGISWTDSTWNPIRGCSRVSEGCRNCYAEKVAYRFSGERLDGKPSPFEGLVQRAPEGWRLPKWNGQIKFVEEHLLDPLKWKKPRQIFVNSMSDLFHENVNRTDLHLILAVMLLCPQHSFQVLTKRPENMKAILTEPGFRSAVMATAAQLAFDLQSLKVYARIRKPSNTTEIVYDCGKDGQEAGCRVSANWPLSNVHLGVSVEDQETADLRIPLLLQTPAAVRFISAEPLLGPVDLTLDGISCPPCSRCADGSQWENDTNANGCRACDGTGKSNEIALDWVIVGGESGAGARPMHPDWARSLRDQCKAAGVPFFFKQWGEWGPHRVPEEYWIAKARGAVNWHEWPDGTWSHIYGTKATGCLLDGVEHHEFPAVSA